MKRKLLSLLLLSVVCTAGAYAQGVKFGVKAGLNSSNLGGYEYMILNEDADFEDKQGLYAGVFTQIYFTPSLGLETGLFYSMLGGKDKESDRLVKYKISADPSYLQLPLNLIYRFNITRTFAITPSMGLYGGYGLGGNIKIQGEIGSVDVGADIDYFDKFANRFDFGGSIGLNFEFNKFVLGLGYDRSIIRVNKEEVIYDDNAFNSNFRATLGFIF